MKHFFDNLLSYIPDTIYFKNLNSKFIRTSKPVTGLRVVFE